MPNGHDSYPSRCYVCGAHMALRTHRWARQDPPELIQVGRRLERVALVPVCRNCAARIRREGRIRRKGIRFTVDPRTGSL